MSTARDDLKNPHRRLPELSLVSEATGSPRPLQESGRTAPVIVLAHGPDCGQCEAFLDHLAGEREAILDWDGQVVVVRSGAPDTDGGAEPAGRKSLQALLDPDGLLARALAIEVPAVVIADQWGEIHCAAEAGADHQFISPAEVAEWVKYLAVQCPECQGEVL
jgi:hypothetical protein